MLSFILWHLKNSHHTHTQKENTAEVVFYYYPVQGNARASGRVAGEKVFGLTNTAAVWHRSVVRTGSKCENK